MMTRLSALILIILALAMPLTARADDPNAAKANSMVQTAINMTDSDQAVKLLWQATDLDPSLEQAYVYLALYYNSRSQFDKVVQVYQKLLKVEPNNATAYLNIGEAFMSYDPPKTSDALPYYRKAFQLDPTSTFAALRIGEILAQQGDRADATGYLQQAARDTTKNPDAAAEAQKVLGQMGAM